MRKHFSLLFLFFLLPWFFVGGPDYYDSRLFKACWNFGHIIFFAVATHYFLLLTVKPVAGRFFKALLTVLLCSFLFGLLIEVIQYGFSRTPDVFDVLRDVLGALIALLWFFWPVHRMWDTATVQYKIFSLLIITATSGVVLESSAVSLVAWDEWQVKQNFPLLADFETIGELNRWSGSAAFNQSARQVAHGDSSLKVTVSTEEYSGIILNDVVADWRAYNQLLFSIYNNEKSPFLLTLRIHDMAHRKSEQLYSDRFNRRIELLPGWNQLVIDLAEIESAPQNRLMDMKGVEQLSLFSVNLKQAKTFYLDYMYLR